MPLSDPSHRPWILARLQEQCDLSQVRTVVDAGAGFGGYEGFFKPYMMQAQWTAIEIHGPYVDRFLLPFRYSQVISADLRDLDPFPAADVVFFGDVLEHMAASDAIRVWDRARETAWRIVLGIPVRDYPQGEVLGNPHEAHVSTWSVQSVVSSFAGIYAHQENADTGAFIAEGKADGPA